jgi:hypothetical protein
MDLTQRQKNYLSYIEKRKIPPSSRDIALQNKDGQDIAQRTLMSLVRLGLLESFEQRDQWGAKRRHYKIADPDKSKVVRTTAAKSQKKVELSNPARIAIKTQEKSDGSCWHNPFAMGVSHV